MPSRESPPLTIRLFGPFDVRVGEEPAPRFRSRTEQRLLALLVLRHGREVERAWLAGMLWPESEERVALSNLRRSLHHLRQALGSEAVRLQSPTPRTLSLDLTSAHVDVAAFDAAVQCGDTVSLEQAVTLYGGPLLEGDTEEWVFQERQTREQAYLGVLEKLAANAWAHGDPARAERYLRLATTLDPLRESAHRALMEALAASGNYAAATHAYRELRLRLHRELNAEPDPATRALFERLRAEARARGAGASSKLKVEALRLTETPGSNLEHAPLEPSDLEPSNLKLSNLEPAGGAGEDTVTFLFADIEGGARLWEERPDVMHLAAARHHAALRNAVETNNGRVFKTVGDTFCAAFATAANAVDAALAARRHLRGMQPPALAEVAELALRVRIAMHTGAAELRDGDYFGPALNRVARLLGVAHGGHVLLSGATQALVQDELPPGASLRDLGLHRLRDLQRPERIYQLLHAELPNDLLSLTSLNTLPNNLPVQVTRFIGREREIEEVKRLLGNEGRGSRVPPLEPRPSPLDPRPSSPNSRLVTLTGAGGTGKTRLALQVAADLLEIGGDGVWFVDLAEVTDPGLVPSAVAAALGMRERGDAPVIQLLVEHLRPKRLLLVLDNCEHLVAACAGLAETLLRTCPAVTILATSREALNIAGETIYRLPSLSVPDPAEWQMAHGQGSMVKRPGTVIPALDHQPSTLDHPRPTLDPQPSTLLQYEAVRLFVDRARAALPSFAITRENAAAVAQVCARLDGIPLAIELAAARVKALSVDRLAERLDDAFRLLTGGRRTALPRQQTLRALIDWSHDLLTKPERVLFRRLSVFAGGWTLEAAEAACAGGAGLGAKGVGCSGTSDAATLRPTPYTLRPEDVVDLLTALVDKSLVLYDEEDNGGRYRFLETVRQYARERLQEAGETDALRRRHRDWCLELAEWAETELRGPEQIAWLDRLDAERDNLRAALEFSRTEPDGLEAELRLFGQLRDYWGVRGPSRETRERIAEVLPRADSSVRTPGRARTLLLAGNLARPAEYARAAAMAEESAVLFRELGDRNGISEALNLQARLAFSNEEYERAGALWEESLALARGTGDRRRRASALNGLGRLAFRTGAYERAARLLDECLAVTRELGDERLTAWALHSLGRLASSRGDYERAVSYLEAARMLFEKVGEKPAVVGALLQLAQVAIRQGDLERATALAKDARALHRQLGYPDSAAARAILAEVARQRGDPGPVVAYHRESLARMREGSPRWGLAGSLEVLAKVCAAQGEAERAARLLGAAAAHREAAGSARPPADQAEYDACVAAVRGALGDDAFAAAWEEGRSMSCEQAIDCALEVGV